MYYIFMFPFQVINKKVEIRADVMVPYHATKAWGQVPCEDVCIRIPIPEAWVYQFRNEKLDVSMGKVIIDIKTLFRGNGYLKLM